MSITLSQLNGYLETVFGTFNKSAPGAKVQAVIWRQVGHLPEPFFEWACQAIAEREEKLPGNIGRYFSQELWHEYRAKNPQLVARESAACADCSGKFDHPGYGFSCFRQEEDGWHSYFSPCRCFRQPHDIRITPMTKAQTLAAGYKLVPDGWKGSVLDYENFLKYGEIGQESRQVGQYGAALNKAGKIDPMGHDERRFRHIPEAEQAEVF